MNSVDSLPVAQNAGMLRKLCYLSFLGCGIGLVMGVMGYFSYTALALGTNQSTLVASVEAPQDTSDSENGPDDVGSIGTDFDKMATSSLIVGILNIAVLGGVLMMWRRKKTGFYVYTLSQVASVVTPLLVVGSFAGGLMALLFSVFPILFIILYGLNLKHMS